MPCVLRAAKPGLCKIRFEVSVLWPEHKTFDEMTNEVDRRLDAARPARTAPS
jgi:hypothetical protein